MPGGRVFCRSWRPATPRADLPVILLHDSLGCVDLWRHFPEALALRLGLPVVAYDRLGFGRSTERDALPSPDFVAEEATRCFPAIREGLGIGPYALFGHSVGGGMALNIAARDRGDCAWVVSESAQAFVEDRTREGIVAARAHFRQPGQLGKLERLHGDKARWVLDAWTEVWLSPAFADWSLDASLGSVRCPVLAVHGDRDEFGSVAFPRRIAAGVAGPSQVEILTGCGHVPHRERQADLLDAVACFVDAHA